MSIEGMGRRRPTADIDFEIQQGIDDFSFEQHQRQAINLLKRARPIDETDKALTGRKIEDYSYQSGISIDELFPRDAKILNIGDPWQRLDREGVTTLEYETGDEASFINDAHFFFKTLEDKIANIDIEIDYINSVEPGVADSLRFKLKALKEFQEYGLSIKDYPKQAKVAREIADEIKGLVSNLYERYPDAWYAATHIARGFSDLHLLETVIKPKIATEIIRHKGLSENEENELYRQLIEEYRGAKTYKKTELVKGAYPYTNFDDDSFDRIVASWSISAHMFAVMKKKDFAITWEETDRILSKNGVAYFWPVNFYFDKPKELLKSLEDYISSGGKAGFVIYNEQDNEEIIWLDKQEIQRVESGWNMVQTLIIVSRQHNKTAIQRVEESLQA